MIEQQERGYYTIENPSNDTIRITFTPGSEWGGEGGAFCLPRAAAEHLIRDLSTNIELIPLMFRDRQAT